jgi:hypothetical protein
VIEMPKRSKVIAMAALISVILAMTSVTLLAQGQIQAAPVENLVEFAERAEQQVKNLIDMITANEEALTKIENVGLSEQFELNVALYETEGLNNLVDAQQALANSEYEVAVDSAIEALRIFREVYSSIHVILEDSDLQKGHLIENQGLLEAITRELQRIDRLRDILPAETPQEILDLLYNAEETLSEARQLLLDGEGTGAKSLFLEAKLSIFQVYQYLKEQAEESNTWRIYSYCERTRERIRERFRYGSDEGIDFTAVLESLGYQSENQFMETLENMIQTAQGKTGDFENAMQDLEAVGQMVQEMDQALAQEINRHQNRYGTDSSTGGSSSGNIGSDYGHGSGGDNKP